MSSPPTSSPPPLPFLTIRTVNARGGSQSFWRWVLQELETTPNLILIITETHDKLHLLPKGLTVLASSLPTTRPRGKVGGVAILAPSRLAPLLHLLSPPTRTTWGCGLALASMAILGIYLDREWDADTIRSNLTKLTLPTTRSRSPMVLGGDLNFLQDAVTKTSLHRAIAIQDFCLSSRSQLLKPRGDPSAHTRKATRTLNHLIASNCLTFSKPQTKKIPLGLGCDHKFSAEATIFIPDPPPPPKRILRLHRLSSPYVRAALSSALLAPYLQQVALPISLFPGIPAAISSGIDPIPPSSRSPDAIRDFFAQGSLTNKYFAIETIEIFHEFVHSTILSTATSVLGTCEQLRHRLRPSIPEELTHAGSDQDITNYISRRLSSRSHDVTIHPRDTASVLDATQDAETYFNSLFAPHPQDLLSQEPPPLPKSLSRDYLLRDNGSPAVSPEDVATCILQYPARKAIGPDGLPSSVLRAVALDDIRFREALKSNPSLVASRPPIHPIFSSLALLFQMCLIASYTPQDWGMAEILPIPKKPTSRFINEFRPISILPQLRRYFENIILRDISENQVGGKPPRAPMSPLSPLQAGFRPNRSAIHHAITLHSCLQSKPLYVALLDQEAAYDSVPIHLVMSRLRLKLPPHGQGVADTIESLFFGNSSRILVNNSRSSPVIRRRGLAQGAPLAPILYNVFLDPLLSALEASEPPDPMNITRNFSIPPALSFADDITLLAASEELLRIRVAIVSNWSHVNFTRLNPAKTTFIAPAHAGPLLMPSPGEPELEILPSPKATYLGIPFTNRGACIPSLISTLATRGNASFFSVARDTSFSADWNPRWRRTFTKVFVLSRIEYGASFLYAAKDPSLSLETLASPLSSLVQNCCRWILSLYSKSKRTPAFPGYPRVQTPYGGWAQVHNITGIPPFTARVQQLAALSMVSICQAPPDMPIHFLNFNVSTGKACSRESVPRILASLASNPMWKEALLLQEEARARADSLRLDNDPRYKSVAIPSVSSCTRIFMTSLAAFGFPPTTTGHNHSLSRRTVLSALPSFHTKLDRGPMQILHARSKPMRDKLIPLAMGDVRRALHSYKASHGCPTCLKQFTFSHIQTCKLLPPELSDILQNQRNLLVKDLEDFLERLSYPFRARDDAIARVLDSISVLDAALWNREYTRALRIQQWLEDNLPITTMPQSVAATRSSTDPHTPGVLPVDLSGSPHPTSPPPPPPPLPLTPLSPKLSQDSHLH